MLLTIENTLKTGMKDTALDGDDSLDLPSVGGRSRAQSMISAMDSIVEDSRMARYVTPAAEKFMDWNECDAIAAANKRRQRRDMCRMFIVLSVPVITLVVVTSLALHEASVSYAEITKSHDVLTESLIINELIEQVENERGHSILFLSSGRSNTTRERFVYKISKVNALIDTIPRKGWPVIHINGQTYTRISSLKSLLTRHRQLLFDPEFSDITHNIHFYTNVTHGLLDGIVSNVILPQGPIWKKFTALIALLTVVDHVGIQNAIGSSFYVQCNITQYYQDWFRRLEVQIRAQFETAFRFTVTFEQTMRASLNQIVTETARIEHLKQALLRPNASEACNAMTHSRDEQVDLGFEWFDLMRTYSHVLVEVANEKTRLIRSLFEDNLWHIQQSLIIDSCLLVASLFICLGICIWYYVCIRALTKKISMYASKLHIKTEELRKEKRKTENLLHEILPKSVAGW